MGFIKVSSRSVVNFGFLGENLNGSSNDFRWAEERHTIVYVGLNWSLLVGLFLASFKLL